MRSAYQAIHKHKLSGNDVRIYAKKNYASRLNVRYISDACTRASQVTQEKALFGGKDSWADLLSGKITKEEWQAKRNNQLYSRGERAKRGNPNIRIDLKASKILVNDPSERGKWIEGKLYLPTKFKPDLTCYSVQLIHRDGKFEVKITWEEDPAPIVTDSRNGCIGIDTNPSGLGLALVSPDGNLLAHQFKGMERIQFARTPKRDYDIFVAAKEVVAEAKLKGMPIAVEKLSFSAKSKTQGFKKSRRMKSNFCYRKMIGAIFSRAAKEGVEVTEVDPAFTSILGKLKYAAPLSLSPHVAAALVIGRRAYGMLEKETFSVIKTETVKVRVKPKKLKKGTIAKAKKKAVTAKSKSIVRLTLAGRDRTQELTSKAYSWLMNGPFVRPKNSFPHRDPVGSLSPELLRSLEELGKSIDGGVDASLYSEPFPITGRERQKFFLEDLLRLK